MGEALYLYQRFKTTSPVRWDLQPKDTICAVASRTGYLRLRYPFRHAQGGDYHTIAGSCSAGVDTSIS